MWTALHGLRYGKVGTITPPATGSGSPMSIFPAEHPSVISAAMNNFGQVAVAIVDPNGAIQIRNQTSGAHITFSGISPVLFSTALIYGSDKVGGIACYYLKPGRVSIYVRLESEGYNIEHIALFNCPFDLARLIIARVNRDRMEIAAEEIYGRRVILKSRGYPTEAMGSAAGMCSVYRQRR